MRSSARVIAPFIIFLMCVSFLSGCSAPASASSAPNLAAGSDFPGDSDQLFAQNAYNLTGSIRDDNLYNRSYESGNLEITKDGNGYLNQSLDPIGTYEGDYSFTNDKSGGLAADFTYTLGSGGSFAVVDSYLGHAKVLQAYEASGGLSYAYLAIDTTTVASISCWMCPSSIAATGTEGIRVYNSSSAILTIEFEQNFGSLCYYLGSSATPLNVAFNYTLNRWYYVEVVINTVTDVFSLTIDGVAYETSRALAAGASSDITSFRIHQYLAGAIYFDAISVTPDATLGAYSSEQDFDDFQSYGEYAAWDTFDGDYTYGNYAGLYSFANDADGTLPAGWSESVADGQVVSSLAGHSKALQITGTGSYGYVINTYAGQTTGTIEFWLFVSVGSSASLGVGGGAMYFAFTSTSITYYTPGGSWPVLVPKYLLGQWNNVRIDFDTGTDTFDFYFNGTQYANDLAYRAPVASFGNFYFMDGGTSTIYIDAVDYSWATGYANGRNHGMDVVDWTEYYEAGTNNASIVVEQSVSGHSNVVNFTKDYTLSSNSFFNNYFSSQTSGTIELWIHPTVATTYLTISLAAAFSLFLSSTGQIVHYPGGVWTPTGYYFTQNAWSHLRMTFDTTTDTWDVYWNGTQILNDAACKAVSDGITYLSLGAYGGQAGRFYLDAVDYSWSSNFAYERNMCENVTGWSVSNSYTASFMGVTVNTSIAGHANVLRFNKTNAGSAASYIYTYPSTASSGTVEWWGYFPIVSNNIYFGSSQNWYFRISTAGQIVTVYSSGTYSLGYILLNAWHHFLVDFDCASDTYDLYVDGHLQMSDIPFNTAATAITYFGITMTTSAYDYFYFDSLDYSWASGYSTNRNWRTLPSVDNRVDATQLGVYNATYSFESDEIFGMPAGFKNVGATSVRAYVSPAIQTSGISAHHNILCLEDNSGTNAVFLYKDFAAQSSGAISFWMWTNDTSKTYPVLFSMRDASAIEAFNVGINTGYVVASGTNLLAAYSNSWYYITVKFYSSYKFDVFINGYLRLSQAAYSNNVNIERIQIMTSYAGNSFYSYVDAIDCSWDSQYSSERSSYLCLQQNCTFATAGAYSYRFQAWSSNTAYSQAWTSFTVVDNVQLISSSSQATQWQLTDLATAPVWSVEYASAFSTETYTESQSSGEPHWASNYGAVLYAANWASDNYFMQGTTEFNCYSTYLQEATIDGFVYEKYPNNNYGVGVAILDVKNNPPESYITYVGFPVTTAYLEWNTTQTLNLMCGLLAGSNDLTVKPTEAFTESGVTWNNQPALIGGELYHGTVNAPSGVYQAFGTYTGGGMNHFQLTSENANLVRFYSKEYHDLYGGDYNGPYRSLAVGKSFFNASNAYIQTNVTEPLNMTSGVMADVSVVAHDRMYFTYTSTGSNLEVVLLHAGVPQATYTLASTIDITASCTFDQVAIRGNFDNTEYLHVTSFNIKSAVLTNKLVQTSSYVLMQTNTLETLTLRSPATLSESIDANCQITLNYASNTTKEVKMNLKLSGVTQQSYTVIAEGGAKATEFVMTAAASFDQLEFVGVFSSAYFQLFSILIESATYTSSVYVFYLSAYERRETSVPLGNYALGVIPYPATGELLLSENVSISSYAQSVLDYTPHIGSERQVNLYDQQNRLLPFEQFRMVVNRTTNGITAPVNINPPHYLMTNRFYADDKSYYNCTVHDRFGETLYAVTDAAIATFIDIQLTVHRLKIYNQAEKFCYVNISKVPDVGLYWSEWIAPNEVIAYDLYADDYVVQVTNYENSSTQQYAYTLSGDDALLIGSQNTIAQAIWNIQNTNATIGNQITAVNISISNQNSAINSSIVMVDINLSNINSTLGTQLIALDSSIQSVNNTIGVNFVSTNSSIYEIGSWVNTSYNLLSAQAYLVNNSIYTTYTVLDAGITNLNNTCNASFSTLIVKSDYLTYIFQNAMFSSTLNWSTNYDVTNDLVYGEFVNRFRNESVDVQVRYNNLTETLKLSALDSVAKYLPKSAEYRVWSVEKQEYLTTWETVNATMDLGWYEESVPISVDSSGWWLFGIIALAYVGVMAGIALYGRRRVKLEKRRQDRQVLRGSSGGLFSEGARYEPNRRR